MKRVFAIVVILLVPAAFMAATASKPWNGSQKTATVEPLKKMRWTQ